MTESYRIVLPGIIYRMLGFSFFGDPAQDLAKNAQKLAGNTGPSVEIRLRGLTI